MTGASWKPETEPISRGTLRSRAREPRLNHVAWKSRLHGGAWSLAGCGSLSSSVPWWVSEVKLREKGKRWQTWLPISFFLCRNRHIDQWLWIVFCFGLGPGRKLMVHLKVRLKSLTWRITRRASAKGCHRPLSSESLLGKVGLRVREGSHDPPTGTAHCAYTIHVNTLVSAENPLSSWESRNLALAGRRVLTYKTEPQQKPKLILCIPETEHLTHAVTLNARRV